MLVGRLPTTRGFAPRLGRGKTIVLRALYGMDGSSHHTRSTRSCRQQYQLHGRGIPDMRSTYVLSTLGRSGHESCLNDVDLIFYCYHYNIVYTPLPLLFDPLRIFNNRRSPLPTSICRTNRQTDRPTDGSINGSECSEHVY